MSEQQDIKKQARSRCMHLLEQRDYTEKQLRDKLRLGKTDYPPEAVEDAIAYVKSFHYVDDGRFCLRYIDCMKEKKTRRQIERELYQKGVDRAVIAAAFEQTESVPEEELIRRWVEKRRFDAETADPKERQRMAAFLARRGFSMDAILRVLGSKNFIVQSP